jgi:hypothetical protein
MPTRAEVYEAVDGEREYQDALKGIRSTEKRTLGDFLVLLNHYMVEANQSYVRNRGATQPMHEIRKIAAIAVKAMEENGAPKR